MIFSEKDLEDYICNNQEKFIKELNKIYGEKEKINFIGRQVRIGENNIADLVYYFDKSAGDKDINFIDRNYIIVELKYRQLEPKDLAQISRYMTILNEKLLYIEGLMEHTVYGLFVSFGQNDLMQDISMNLPNSNIDYIEIKNDITFKQENWHHKEEYIENIKLDQRIIDLDGNSNE